MSTPLIVLLVLLGMFIVPWLFDKVIKPAAGGEITPKSKEALPKPKNRIRRKRSLVHQHEDEFPDYDPSHNDELEWKDIVELKFRKHPGYPPDWERRRVMVFLRDGGKCQSQEHRGGNCGRLLCEPDQIWHFTYNIKLLVDAHVDHIKPISVGGDHDLANLQLLCARCHSLRHPGNSKLDAMILPRIAPRGKERKKFLKTFYVRKAPKPPDSSVPF
ncbi:MAG: HNH endonuclease [Verrucomicrobia bacterium]|nr:HNH endonuclease [Verrucomicrobiota bacterium]